MNNKKKVKADNPLFYSVLFLVAFGFLMVISAHAVVHQMYGTGTFYFEIAKILFFTFVGFVMMREIIFEKIGTKKHHFKISVDFFSKNIRLFLIIVSAMMISTLFFGEVNGAKAWIQLPGMSVQPVEFLKITFIIYLANHLSKYHNTDASVWDVIKVPLGLLLVYCAFIIGLQNDLGNALIIFIISLFIFLGIPDKRFNKIKLAVLILIIVAIVLFYYFGPALSEYIYSLPADTSFRAQLLRIAVLFDPLKDVYESGFQLSNSLVALNEGGLFGVGYGNSNIKFIVPEPYNDAIIAVITEELGIILGIIPLFTIYFFIVTKLINYAKRKNMNYRDRLILIGIASYFMAQFFVNIGGMVGLIPMTGVTLLFVSSGGTSILSAFIAIGIAQNVIRKSNMR